MMRGARREGPGVRGAAGVGDRNAAIAERLPSIAARSTCATVCRIIPECRRPSGDAPRTSRGPTRASSRAALRQVLEPRVLLDERELHRPHRAVALLADDD